VALHPHPHHTHHYSCPTHCCASPSKTVFRHQSTRPDARPRVRLILTPKRNGKPLASQQRYEQSDLSSTQQSNSSSYPVEAAHKLDCLSPVRVADEGVPLLSSQYSIKQLSVLPSSPGGRAFPSPCHGRLRFPLITYFSGKQETTPLRVGTYGGTTTASNIVHGKNPISAGANKTATNMTNRACRKSHYRDSDCGHDGQPAAGAVPRPG